ncbi:MAG: cytochrome c [Nitrospirae bacterium]|nr:cytochrome c [Nitrospirota bacterium]
MKQLIGWAVAVLAIMVGVGGCSFFQDPHVTKGRELFQYYCIHCHGPKGKGDGFNAKFLDPHPRDLTDSREEYIGPQTNEEIYATLSRDIVEEKDTKPEDNWVPAIMPTFKYTLSDEERWSIVAYVRTLQKNEAGKVDFSKPLSTERHAAQVTAKISLADYKPDQLKALEEKGAHLYRSKFVCSSCHAIDEKGGHVGPDLSRSGIRLNPWWVYRWIKAPQSIKRDTKMPNFGLSDDEALAITAYLSTLRSDKTIEPPTKE